MEEKGADKSNEQLIETTRKGPPKKAGWGANRPLGKQGNTAQEMKQNTPISHKWYEYYDDQGFTYYYNPISGKSVWEYPGQDAQILSQYQDEPSGNWYFYNWTTGESEWE